MSDHQTIQSVNPSQQLYRLYDADGALLYIGISYSAISRFAQHKADKPWIASVARIEIETREVSRSEIEAIERDAIISEKPKHNKQHNSMPVAPRGNARMTQANAKPDYRWLAIGDVVALGLRNGECPIGRVIADSMTDDRLPFGHVLLGLVNFFTGEIGDTQRLVAMSDVVLGKAAETMNASDKAELGYRPHDVIFDTDPLGDFQTEWKRRHRGSPDHDNDDLPAGEPSLFSGSLCRHATYGSGRVFERVGQRMFHVSFDTIDTWISRHDPEVVRWEP